MEPATARRTWRTVEPIHGIGYFAAEMHDALAGLGFPADERDGYFACRSAPMGPVGAEVVVATFFNFDPRLVRHAIPRAWSVAEPAALVDARLAAMDLTLRRLLGEAVASPEMAEAAGLARRAAEVAVERPEGRPLFAAHAGLAWPTDPHLVLWHAQTLLREFRGDGHLAALTLAGVNGCQALVLHGATGEVPAAVLQSSRGWSDEAWETASEQLRARGWLGPDGTLTDAGRQHRDAVEDATDASALAPYEVLGDDGCERLRALARPWSKAIVASGELFGFRPATGASQ